MGKSVVYSWRLEPQRKASLEDVARRRKQSVAELLDEAVGQWLRRQELDSDAEEQRVREAARRSFGRIAGGDSERASQARLRLRRMLRAKSR